MSGVLNASFVEPAARQARRFSATSTTVEVSHAHETQQARIQLTANPMSLAHSRAGYRTTRFRNLKRALSFFSSQLSQSLLHAHNRAHLAINRTCA